MGMEFWYKPERPKLQGSEAWGLDKIHSLLQKTGPPHPPVFFVLVDPSDWMISCHNGESRSFTKAVGSNARLFQKSFIGSPRLTHHLFGTPQPSQTAKLTTTTIKQTHKQKLYTTSKQSQATTGKKSKNTKSHQWRSQRDKKIIKGNILPNSICDP